MGLPWVTPPSVLVSVGLVVLAVVAGRRLWVSGSHPLGRYGGFVAVLLLSLLTVESQFVRASQALLGIAIGSVGVILVDRLHPAVTG